MQEYWKAAVALLDLRFAEEELRTIQGSSLPESPLKRAAIASARARTAEAKMELRRQREELASRYGALLDGPLPLPADKPFVGPYDTKILGIYSSRRPPRDAIELDRLIAETAEIAAARGEAAAYAADARNAAGASVEQYLAAFDRCRDARIAFLAAVRDYNLAIANYALYVSDPSLPPESVAKMLVDVPVFSTDGTLASLDPTASRPLAAPASPALVSLLDADQAVPPREEFVAGAGSDFSAATPPSLPPTEGGVQPATAIVPAQEEVAAGPLDIVVDEVAVAPREIVPSDADEPIGSEAETSDLEPTPSGLRPADETLAPTDSLEEIQPEPPVTGLQFSGAAVR